MSSPEMTEPKSPAAICRAASERNVLRTREGRGRGHTCGLRSLAPAPFGASWLCRGCAIALVVCGVRVAPVGAVELDRLFPSEGATAPVVSAEALVEAAFSNLFELDGEIRVEATQAVRDGETTTSSFRVFTKSFEQGIRRMLIVTPDPESVDQQMRMLEVTQGDEQQRARLFVPRLDSQPMATRFRITDPFLGAFSNLPPEEVRADLNSLVRSHEIVSREPGDLAGIEVDRITLRPRAGRGLERVELWIERSQALILEYRYFEGTDSVPARVVQAPREEMQPFAGRIVPGMMLYEDRVNQISTRVRLEYESLPPEMSDDPFMESTFYRAILPD